jgi:lipid A 3-O-deacylase
MPPSYRLPRALDSVARFKFLVALVVFSSVPMRSDAIDSASFDAGIGNFTTVVRFGAESDWQQKWFERENTFIGGYWDLTVADWHGTRYRNLRGDTENILDLGLTPVFRFQRQGRVGPYFEAAIGANLLSKLYDNNGRMLSTRFEFGDSVGFGYQFTDGWDAGIKLQHFSNGGIEEPNSGVNYVFARIAKRF